MLVNQQRKRKKDTYLDETWFRCLGLFYVHCDVGHCRQGGWSGYGGGGVIVSVDNHQYSFSNHMIKWKGGGRITNGPRHIVWCLLGLLSVLYLYVIVTIWYLKTKTKNQLDVYKEKRGNTVNHTWAQTWTVLWILCCCLLSLYVAVHATLMLVCCQWWTTRWELVRWANGEKQKD